MLSTCPINPLLRKYLSCTLLTYFQFETERTLKMSYSPVSTPGLVCQYANMYDATYTIVCFVLGRLSNVLLRHNQAFAIVAITFLVQIDWIDNGFFVIQI